MEKIRISKVSISFNDIIHCADIRFRRLTMLHFGEEASELTAHYTLPPTI